MTIYLAADHAGYNLKEKIKSFLEKEGYEVKDFGAFSYNPDDDYPDFIHKAAEAVSECSPSTASTSSQQAGLGQKQCRGIIFGGSGQAEAMAANRYKGVRATVFYCPSAPKQAADITGRESSDPLEIIRLSREHNDSNILSLGARFIHEDDALKAVKLWLETPFSNEERHKRRIDKF